MQNRGYSYFDCTVIVQKAISELPQASVSKRG